jgi:hypothetical protein
MVDDFDESAKNPSVEGCFANRAEDPSTEGSFASGSEDPSADVRETVGVYRVGRGSLAA